METYNNYLEQFNHLVENAVLFNNIGAVDEFYIEDMQENEFMTEEIAELDIYQMFVIEPTDSATNEDLERFGAWYWKNGDVWILNVYHFGTAWDYVQPFDLADDEM